MNNSAVVFTKSLLQEYSNALKQLDAVNRKIDYYSKLVNSSEHGVVKGSMKDYPYAEKHFVLGGSNIKDDTSRQEKIKQLLCDLSSSREKYNDIVLEIGIALESISDDEIRTILFEKYVNNKTDAEIAKLLGYERSTITHKINNFLQNSH